jgi:cytochrome c biogenesis protein
MSEQNVVPDIGAIGLARWAWRQLTSMRTALILLMLLGVAAIPGSLFPQRNQDPQKVDQYFLHNPTLAHWIDRFRLFDVYASPWFSAIYLLLFISLIGCVLPRTFEHLKAIGKKPPLTPKNLDRMEGYQVLREVSAGEVAAELKRAEKWLKKSHYRLRIQEGSISAEKGYLRETGNLMFHLSLILILVGVALGSLFGMKGEAIVNVGDRFINTPTSYDTITYGKFQGQGSLIPFALTVSDFAAKYDPITGQPTDYTLTTNVENPIGSTPKKIIIKVNKPLTYGSTKIYLQANGYSPLVTIRDKSGAIVFSGPTIFLPQDADLTSVGAIKEPDMTPQIGFIGTFLPTAQMTMKRGGFSSYPEVLNPELLLSAWKGNLGLDSGNPQSVYQLNTAAMKEIGIKALLLGDTYSFGEGSITFDGWKSWVNLQIVEDPGKMYALFGAIFAILGLLISLFTRQRRIWVKVGQRVEIAGLAKNGIPGLDDELLELADYLSVEHKHEIRLDDERAED